MVLKGSLENPGTRIRNALESIASLNEELLRLLLLNSSAQCWPEISRIVSSNRDRVPLLLNACQFALFDIKFQDSRAWTSALESTITTPLQGPAAWAAPSIPTAAYFVSWNLVRQSPSTARILLGASAAVVRMVSSINLIQLLRILAEHPDWFQPRWHDRPETWCQLMLLANNEHAESGDALKTRAISLFLGHIVK